MTGFTIAQTISEDGVRQTSVRSFITPVADRKNLHVAVNATVTKVRTIGKKVTGVDVLLVRLLYQTYNITFLRLFHRLTSMLILFAEWKEAHHKGKTRSDFVSGSDKLTPAVDVVWNWT